MRTSKHYSNVGTTKRVDHEAGRHRPKRAAAEPAECLSCGALYVGRRWVLPETAHESPKHQEWRPQRTVTCPACKQIKDGLPSGFVHLKGRFLADHRGEIERLVLAEAGRAAVDNPLGRIMELKEAGEELVVSTTTEHLAKRLGQALEKAFAGHVRYDFSHENKLARVYWERN